MLNRITVRKKNYSGLFRRICQSKIEIFIGRNALPNWLVRNAHNTDLAKLKQQSKVCHEFYAKWYACCNDHKYELILKDLLNILNVKNIYYCSLFSVF